MEEKVTKVLLIDDNFFNQKVTKIMLEQLGYDPTLARNGKEGLEKAMKDSFSLIILDICMPLMDGYTVAKNIRKKGPNTETPILAFTAVETETKDKCLKAGMNGHLSKPLMLDVLKREIEKYI